MKEDEIHGSKNALTMLEEEEKVEEEYDDDDDDVLDTETNRDLRSAENLAQVVDAALLQTTVHEMSSLTASIADKQRSECRDCEYLEMDNRKCSCASVTHVSAREELQLTALHELPEHYVHICSCFLNKRCG